MTQEKVREEYMYIWGRGRERDKSRGLFKEMENKWGFPMCPCVTAISRDKKENSNPFKFKDLKLVVDRQDV